jgi:hypothetical protein
MGAGDQNVAVGITGAGSGRPPATMRAVVLDAPGPPSALAIRELPVPVPSVGWVLIRVRAFGLNRLELYLRLERGFSGSSSCHCGRWPTRSRGRAGCAPSTRSRSASWRTTTTASRPG